jgi:DNA-binding response OmpR family regulator
MYLSTSCFHLLLLDPSASRRHGLVEALRQRGFVATECEAAEAALALVEGPAGRPAADLLLIRTDGPGRHALHLLRKVRAASSIPVVLLGTALDGSSDRVAALELGADDYFGPAMPVPEVVARIRAVLRRAGPITSPQPAQADAPARWRAIEGGWRLEPHRRAVVDAAGGAVPLTGAEFELLRVLSAALGEAVDRETISRSVFRRPWRAEDRAVDGLVKRLRRKLTADAIASVRGVGYALRFAESGPEQPPHTSDHAHHDGLGHAEVEICAPDAERINTQIQSPVVK